MMGALTAYRPAAIHMSEAFEGIALEILKTGEPGPNDPGHVIIFIAR
jgi:hypothetical protein